MNKMTADMDRDLRSEARDEKVFTAVVSSFFSEHQKWVIRQYMGDNILFYFRKR